MLDLEKGELFGPQKLVVGESPALCLILDLEKGTFSWNSKIGCRRMPRPMFNTGFRKNTFLTIFVGGCRALCLILDFAKAAFFGIAKSLSGPTFSTGFRKNTFLGQRFCEIQHYFG